MSFYPNLQYHGKISRVTGVQFCIMSPEEIRQRSVVEVTKPETYIGNVPVPNGLFDVRMGVLDNGKICPTDGLDNVFCPNYFGHINLALPVYYIQWVPLVMQCLNNICIKCGSLLVNRHELEAKMSKKKGAKRFADVTEYVKTIKRDSAYACKTCGTRQPHKYYRDEVAKIYGEWKSEGGPVPQKALITPEQVLTLFKRLTDEDVEFLGFHRDYCRPERMVCTVLPVCPPAVRPSVRQDNSQRMEDDLTHKYVDIIKINKSINQKMASSKVSGKPLDPKFLEDARAVLQYHVATLMDNEIPNGNPATQRTGRPLKAIRQRIKGKDGRIRSNLMGKRVNQSGRSVITPDPNIEIDQIGVPYKMCQELSYPEKVTRFNIERLRKMVENGPEEYPGAKSIKRNGGVYYVSLKHVDRKMKARELQFGDVVERHLIENDYVLFNRQPSLHKMSMMGHRVKPMDCHTFRLNPNAVTPYNADFDGDEMNLHVPQSLEAATELRCLAAVPKQIVSAAKNKPVMGIVQDTLVGVHMLTQDKTAFNNREMMNLQMWNPKATVLEDKQYWSGHDVMSSILPKINIHMANKSFDDKKETKDTSENYIVINEGKIVKGIFDKDSFFKPSQGMVHVSFGDFGPQYAKELIDNTCAMVTNYLLHKGFSVGIGDLMASEEIHEKVKESIEKNGRKVEKLMQEIHLNLFENLTSKSNQDEFERQVMDILKVAVEESGGIVRANLNKDNRLVKMVKSGSKGQTINISQMIACLGQQAVDGKRVAYGFNDRTLPHYHRYDDSPEARGFVKNSFIHGLDPQEMFFHAMGGREGLIDTAVKTSETGYIQRKLVKALEDARVQYDKTVRDSGGNIIQFLYGEDGMDACYIETQFIIFPLFDLNKKAEDSNISDGNMPKLMDMYRFHEDEKYDIYMTSDAIHRFRQTPRFQELLDEHFNQNIVNLYYTYIRDVCKMSPKQVVNYPVCFERLILNTKLKYNITKGQLSDLTPTEVLTKISEVFNVIRISKHNDSLFIFKLLFYSQLSPKRVIFHHRFTRIAFDDLLSKIVMSFKKALVEPGEMVGTLAAQSIGEPATQMTLNTFHFAGVGEKSNVTRGVPRIRELLHITKNPKNPSLTIHLKDEYSNDTEKTTMIMNILELTKLRDITLNTSIYYDPDNKTTVLQQDKTFLDFFKMFENMTNTEQVYTKSRWVLRIELNKKAMLDKHLLMEDVYYAIYTIHGNDIQCVYSDDNSEQLMLRIRINDKDTSIVDAKNAYDDYYLLKMLEKNLLDKVVLRGIPGINKVMTRKIKDDGEFDAYGNFAYKEKWVLDTDGSNATKPLLDALIQPCVDETKTISNDVNEVYAVLGVEAARNVLIKETNAVITNEGDYVNIRHINLLVDAMTCRGGLMSIDRHGINRGDIGPLAKCSFEETDQQLYKASAFGELDNVTGVSSNIMLGQVAPCGTGIVDILFDELEFQQYFKDKEWKQQFVNWNQGDMKNVDLDELEDDELELERGEGYCSTENLQFSFNPELF